MKLHLPLSLYKSLLVLMGVCAVTSVQAGLMHQDVAIQVYTDFGQNKGRYVTGAYANELVQYIRQQEGGIAIPYTDGSDSFYIANEQGMINFAGTGDGGCYAAIAPNVIATVEHNGTQNASFAERVVGNDHAINYSGIDIRGSSVFRLAPILDNGNYYDYMLQRQSKIVTDAVYNPLTGEYDVNTFTGDYLYHSGAGTMCLTHGGVSYDWYCSGYNYITGGVMTITGTTYNDTNGNDSIISDAQYATGRGADEGNPLPNGIQGGDSGSPIFVYNSQTKQYEYVAAMQSGSTNAAGAGGRGWNQARVNVKWTHEALNSFNASVGMGADRTEVHLNAITTEGKTESDGTNSGTIYSGVVKDAAGNQIVSYNGVLSGLNTWGALNDLKDTQNWYAYDSEAYLQRGDTELFFNNNLVFSSSAAENTIVLNDTVDLGIGYAEFSGGKFSIVSEMKTEEGQQVSEGNLFNHAGYVIHEGAEVHLKLVNPEEYMTEWRKTGAGALYIDGSGNTNALLNVGGSGTAYLQQTGGYAAYNVLASSGATVEIADTDQIKRDFTFGAGGGVLNMNGNSMVWNNDNGADAAGFTIHALDELAMVANLTSGTTATLTWTQGGSQTFLGSFLDNGKDSSLQFVYEGGEGARLTMHGIRTKLTAPGSGITVNSGTLVLAGSLTEHAKGSATGRNGERLVRENDWHYADATTQVAVNDGGTFELGSHARLVGDVTVSEGGTYVMREGVAHAAEYVEGGMMLEATSQYAGYYGHKGDVVLNGGKLDILFNNGVDTNTTYAGDISGRGDITVDTGNDGGSLTLSGTVSATGKKSVTGGTLLLTGAAATDNGSGKWLVESGGQMSLDNIDMIDAASTGTLVLSRDTAAYVDHSNHSQMLLGAEAGKEVQYGAAGTTETLCDWNLGGAGSLVVNYVVSGSETLTVDGRGGNSGVVRLQQIADDYAGTINVQSEGGRMVLDIVDAELKTTVNVKEGGVLRGTDVVVSGSNNTVELNGDMEYDSFTVREGAALNLCEDGRLDADNAATITGTGVMRLNRYTLADKVNLENGGTMYGNGGTIGATAEVLATEGTGKLNAGNGTFNINGSIGAAEGATLRLENGTFNVSHGSLNANGGTLELACSTINLSYLLNNCTQTIGGTLSIDSNLTMYVEQGDPYKYNGIVHSINHLHINSGYKLSIVESNQDWRHVFHVSSLTGEGEILWKAENRWFAHTAMGPSRLILTGDNAFKGTLIVQQLDNHGSMQHVSLEHENAAKNMVINLWGDSDSRPGLAISTANSNVAGIGGTENTFVYAGAVKTSGDGNNPVSTALNTLTINTAGVDHTYNGTLLGDADYGLNVVKTGAGKQTFTSSANVVHDLTVMQGSLVFSTTPTVYGEMSVAQGALLQVGSDAVSLDAGETLRILSGTEGGVARLNNELVLNGGGICFSAYNTDQYILSTSGISKGANYDSLQITFANESSIVFGTQYKLTAGDWSSYADSITITEGAYTQAAIQANASGLSVEFSLKEGYSYWDGQSVDLAADSKLIFNQSSNATAAVLRGSASVAVFDIDSEFAVSSADNGELDFARIDRLGKGSLVVDATINADDFRVAESGSITGSGLLKVGRMSVAKEAQATITDLDIVVESDLAAAGTLRLGKGAGLQLKDAASGNIQLLSGSEMTVSAASLAANLTFGEEGEDGRVSLRMAGSGLALNGAVGVQGNTSLAVHGSGNLTFNSAFNKLSSLELTRGVGLNQTTAITTHLVLDGASASAKGGDILRGDITVKNSGSFSFTGGDDILRHTQDSASYGKTITVCGGALAFGDTRQTMGAWSLVLSDGASVTGNGGSYNSGKKAALDFNRNNSTIYATSGTSTISAVTRLRDGNNLNYDVSKGATLTVSGLIHSDDKGGAGSITKDGEGTLELSAANTYADTTTVNGGTLKTSVTGALGTSALVVNDGGTVLIGGNNNQILASDVTVNAGGTLSFTGNGADMMKYSGAKSLTVAGGTVDFGTTRQTIGDRKLVLSDDATITGVGNATYGAMDFNLTNATISVTSGKNNTISAVTRLRGTESDVNLNYDVDTDAVLTVSGRIHADGSSDRGSITKKGQGELVLSVANAHAGTTTVSEGTLRVTSTGSLGSSAVKVNSGATLVLEASSGSSSAVQLDKVTLDSGAALELQGGTYSLNGNLDSAGGKIVLGIDALSTNGAHRSLNGLVEVTSDITVTGGQDKRLDVAQGAELRLCDGASMHRADQSSYHIKGSLSTAKNAENVRFTSVDDIHLNYDNNGATGSIDVAEGSDLTLSVSKLQSYNSAAINVGKDARLDMSGTQNILLSRDTAVNLQSGATLALQHLEFSNKADSGTTTLKSGGATYALQTASYELNNGHMTFNATSQATVKLKLTQSSVENACGHLLTLDNAGNTLTGVHASSGRIKLLGQVSHELESLSVGDSLAVSAYTGETENAAMYASLLVSGLAEFGTGVTLNADMVLQSGAVVDMGDTVTLDGMLSLQTGLTLSGAVLDVVQGLAVGESHILFTGVDGLNLQQAVTLYNMRSLAEQTEAAVSYSAVMDGEDVMASDYFSNLAGNNSLMLRYNGADGTVTITNTQTIPEPATATLSLLALAALCSRRRRR